MGVGKPWDIARCYEFGWDIFDCVLPTRDGRHQRLYNFKELVVNEEVVPRGGEGSSEAKNLRRERCDLGINSKKLSQLPVSSVDRISERDNIKNLDLKNSNSYEFLYISRGKFATDTNPIGLDCDCFTCQNYSRAYVHHLFKIKDMLAYRLAVIHNLRTYNQLVKVLGKSKS